MKPEIDPATDFSTQALSRLQQHFIIIRTPPADLGGTSPCGCKRHGTQGGVLVPIDPVHPEHGGAPCWSGRPLAWFWMGSIGHPSDPPGLVIHRYTGRVSGGTGMRTVEEEETHRVFDLVTLDAFLRAAEVEVGS